MAFGPITLWHINGGKVEIVADFIFLGSKITENGDCRPKIKGRLPLGGIAIIKLDSILKTRGIILPIKVDTAKAMVFPAAMYGCLCWTIKKAGHWRIHAFKLWCWIRLQRVPWTARKSNQSILRNQSRLFTGKTDAKTEAPIRWHPDEKNWFILKDPDAGKEWGQVEKGMTEDEMVGWYQWLNGDELEETLGDGEDQRSLVCNSPWGHKLLGTTCNWTKRQQFRVNISRLWNYEESSSSHHRNAGCGDWAGVGVVVWSVPSSLTLSSQHHFATFTVLLGSVWPTLQPHR